jgi:hypothetical protein
VPTVVDAGGGGAVEVGVEFTASVNGTISGIRFYKSATNTGVHVGNLWSIGGSLLASATFTGETASGWQTVTFSSPVAITAGMVYVASYHTNGSHFSADLNYFATAGVNNPPLQALSNGVNGGNGVYVYSSASTFPNNTYESTNYWVDVVFTPAPTAILESIEVAANNLTVNVGATQQFTATGTYEDNSTQDITAQVTWSSSNTTDATINTTGLATGLAVGSSQISATLNSVSGNSVGLTVQLPVCPCIPSATVLATPINGHTAYGDVNNGDGLLSWINPNGGNSFYTYMSSIVAWTDNSLPACGGEPGYYYYSFEPCSDYLIPPADQAAMMIGAALVWQHYASNDNMISAAVTWATYVMNNGSSSEWAWPTCLTRRHVLVAAARLMMATSLS